MAGRSGGERGPGPGVPINVVAVGGEVVAVADPRFFRGNPFDAQRPTYYVDTHFDKPGNNHGVSGVASGIEQSYQIGTRVLEVLDGSPSQEDTVLIVLRRSGGITGKRVLIVIGEDNAADADKHEKDEGTQSPFGNGLVRP